jgi:hypothetical protein
MMSWHDKPITIRNGNVIATVKDDVDDQECLWAFKDGEEPPERCRVTITIDGTVVAEYVRSFTSSPDEGHVSNFLKKVLRDPAYRAQYLVSGSWDGIVVDDNPVNVSTRSDVARINSRSMAKLRFKDFASLKVGGRDAFSRLNGTELDGAIPPGTIVTIHAALEEDDARDQAKRWVARGLHVDKAIRKVKTDAEIRENAVHGRRA